MKLTKRSDGRKFDQMREIEAKVGVVKRADGSAMFKIGNSIAYAAVYGPRELHPGHLQDPTRGKLRCNYNMMAFSGSGERVRPGPSRRSKEIGLVTEKALTPVLDLSHYKNMAVDVFIELVQTDSGTRCAGICAAAMALADAGIPMRDMVSAIAVGKVGDKVIVDLTKEEEDVEEAVDMAVAFTTRGGEVSLLQMDGIIEKNDVKDALKAAKKACEQISKIQMEALKKKYKK